MGGKERGNMWGVMTSLLMVSKFGDFRAALVEELLVPGEERVVRWARTSALERVADWDSRIWGEVKQ